MTISDKIFEILQEKGMTQKEFSERTGIAQSAISDWKRKRTNPVSEKILIICEVLGITPEELLSGAEGEGLRNKECDYLVISKNSGIGELLIEFEKLDVEDKNRIIRYMDNLKNNVKGEQD